MIRQLFEEVKQPLPPRMDNMDTNGLKRIINYFLQQRRYVFVLDDVWHIPEWQFLKIIFPECNCGSRIVLTTRNNDLASFACKEYHGSVYNLKTLASPTIMGPVLQEGISWESLSLTFGISLEAKEGVAEGYVNELISRSLVQVAKKREDGRSESYRIHDLWREIVVSKSREQNIVSLASAKKVRRLSLHTNLDDIQINCFALLRSLLVFSKEDPLSMLSKVVSLGRGARLLTVLDLRGTDLKTFPEEIVKLVHLTYLSLRETEVKLIPKSIGNLKKLETLDLKLTRVIELPEEILKLQYLCHLLLSRDTTTSGCYEGFHFKSGFKAPKGIGSLTSLQKLSYIEADNGSNNSIVLTELGKQTQLRKLHILRLPQEDGKVLCSSLDGAKEEDEIIDLDSLSSAPRRLRTLYLKGRLQNLPHWIHSLHNLTRVCLGWSKLRDVDPLQPFQTCPIWFAFTSRRLMKEKDYVSRQMGFKASNV